MTILNLFGDLSIEVGDDFNPSTATPRELSQIALDLIEAYPGNWKQGFWHLWQSNSHSFTGFIDLVLGAKPKPYNDPNYWGLQNPVQKILGLSDKEWNLLTDYNNTYTRLKELHRYFFIDGIYGDGEYDSEGFDLYGVDSLGYDREGYNSEGFDPSGYNAEGYNSEGYDYEGYDKWGFDSLGFDKDGYDSEGFNNLGFDSDGFDRLGFDKDGVHYSAY